MTKVIIQFRSQWSFQNKKPRSIYVDLGLVIGGPRGNTFTGKGPCVPIRKGLKTPIFRLSQLPVGHK